MTTQDQRIFDLLQTIEHTPGISAGQLLARTTSVTEKTFRGVIVEMTRLGLIVTKGMKEQTAYYLTDAGRGSLACGELPAPTAAQQDAEQEIPAEPEVATEAAEAAQDEFVNIPVFGALPETKAGADEVIFEAQVCEPLPVIDLDHCTLDVALAEVHRLTAERRKPSSVDDCLVFLREFSDCVQPRFPAAAAMLNCTANHLEKVYQQDV
jgi:predicted transcriptional regulator